MAQIPARRRAPWSPPADQAPSPPRKPGFPTIICRGFLRAPMDKTMDDLDASNESTLASFIAIKAARRFKRAS